MAYCRKCKAEVVFGYITSELAEKHEAMAKKKGRKIIFAGCCVMPDCPECSSILEEMEEFEEDE